MKGRLMLYGFWFICAVILGILAFGYRDSASAILAEVEPQKYAISFQKPIKIRKIYVIPGQQVKKGDKLIKVERPDLLLDSERKTNSLLALKSKVKIKEIEKSNKLTLAKIGNEQRTTKIETDIQQLKLVLANNQQLSKNLESLNLWPDSVQTLDHTYIQVKIKQLEQELISEKNQYQIEISEIHQVYQLEQQNLQQEIGQLEQEIELLKIEESELIQYALVDGTIGNVYSDHEELVPPYNNLISVYENNPTIIRALVNEHVEIDVKTGDEVTIESTNRKYKTKGKVLEIGSRIIEYPSRLKSFAELPVWGRELFIKIPEESNFLNGEKVFVILD
jgi:HlyD family secretion protein